MSRFLFVVPPLVGHVNPAVGVAAELAARGHEVAWAGHAELVRHARRRGRDVVFDCAMPGRGLAAPAGARGPAALRFLWEEFLIPLADAMAPGRGARRSRRSSRTWWSPTSRRWRARWSPSRRGCRG